MALPKRSSGPQQQQNPLRLTVRLQSYPGWNRRC